MHGLRATEGRIGIGYSSSWIRDHINQYTPCSLGSVLGNIALGTVCLDTLPRANSIHTYLRGKHWQCSNAPVMMKISTIKTFAGKQNENTVVVQISPNLLTLAHTNYTSPNYYQRYENKATQTNWWEIPFRWAIFS